MHIVTILRYYLGLTQTELAERSGVSYADINEIENKPDYGQIGKYCKLAKYLHVPVHAIAMNDIFSITETFFETMQPASYMEPVKTKKGMLGREGEDAVFLQERKRLASVNSCLAHLVIPCYKLRISTGYDILSYKEDGTPIFIEVKNSEKETLDAFRLTKNEYETAAKLTSRGYEYWIYYYSGWNTENQTLKKVLFRDLVSADRVAVVQYVCDVREREERENGILHFRREMGISQIEAANLLEIPASCLCKYENGESQCPVTAYQKMARLYGVKIDDLLQDYPSPKAVDLVLV